MAYGPVILSVVGDSFPDPTRIECVVWEGATAAGDTVRLEAASGPTILWKGRTDTTHTYQGVSFGLRGLSAPQGFRLAHLSAGTVLVYLRED